MREYMKKVKEKEDVDIDAVLDEFNRLTLGESRGRPTRGRPTRARGSNDPAPNERETMQENPPDQKEKQSRSKKTEKQTKQQVKK